MESIKLLLNSSGEFQTELANVGDKALSRWTADGCEMPNIFLLITERRPSAFWDSHPTSPAQICAKPRGCLCIRGPTHQWAPTESSPCPQRAPTQSSPCPHALGPAEHRGSQDRHADCSAWLCQLLTETTHNHVVPKSSSHSGYFSATLWLFSSIMKMVIHALA